MPSSPKIPKELILQTALRMLIRDGYASINIKAVAKELGCSTQPISWHFGNMEAFRTALTDVAGKYVKSKLWPQGESGNETLEEWGRRYLDIAMEEPNLFRFACMGESDYHEKNGMSSWMDYEQNIRMLEQLIREYNLTREIADQYMQTMIIYIHGMACLVSSRLVIENKESVYQMLRDTGDHFLLALRMKQKETEV